MNFLKSLLFLLIILLTSCATYQIPVESFEA